LAFPLIRWTLTRHFIVNVAAASRRIERVRDIIDAAEHRANGREGPGEARSA